MNDDILELLWIEYQELAEEAQKALLNGEENLKILGLLILTHKARSRYEAELSNLLFEL